MENGMKSAKLWDNTPEGVIPFSVADMEFMTAPEIVEGLKRFLDTNVLGYASAYGCLQKCSEELDEETSRLGY